MDTCRTISMPIQRYNVAIRISIPITYGYIGIAVGIFRVGFVKI